MTHSAARPLPRARGTSLLYRVPAKILRSKRFGERGDSFRPFGAPPSTSPQKNTTSFFGDPGEGGKGMGGRPCVCAFWGALRRKGGRGLRALRGRDDSFRLVHGINNPSVRLVPRLTPSCAVETALSSPQSQHVRRCVPRGLTARLASPLPTHLLRICAGALKRHG